MDAISVLENIKLLREFDGEYNDLILKFIKNISHLSKSPIAIIINEKSENIFVLEEKYGFEKYGEDALKDCVNLATTMKNRVIENTFSYQEINFDWLDFNNQIAIAIKIDKRDESLLDSFIFIIIDIKTKQQLSDTIIRLLMVTDIPMRHKYNILPKENNINIETSSDILEVLSMLNNQEKFILSSMILVNEIATRFECSQVSIGWEKGDYIEVIAISHIEKFDRHTDQIEKLSSIYEECAKQDRDIVYPDSIDDSIISFAHKNYQVLSGVQQIISIPIRIDNRVMGVIICEKQLNNFDDKDIISIRLIANYTANLLKKLNEQDRWIGGKVLLKTRKYLAKFFTPKHTLIKFSSIIFTILIVYAMVEKWEYKIDSIGNFETDNVSFLSAPFNGFVYDVKIHEGDKVSKGDILLLLDKEELYLKESESTADINKYKREAEKARARGELANMRISLSKKEQSEASLKRVQYNIEKSIIKAPIDGIIVQGDKEDLIGSPVNKGNILFKIANPIGLYLKLKVKESDIDEIKIGQKGEFSLISSPKDFYKFQVEKIIPMAEVDKSEGNIFIIKAIIKSQPKKWWRPGMSSVAKIETGQRNIMWIMTHNIVDFFRIYFWI
jgi:hypothetical protein